MADYRLYFVSEDDHIVGVRELACPDDEAAVSEALDQAQAGAMELWQGGRIVRKFPVRRRIGEGT